MKSKGLFILLWITWFGLTGQKPLFKQIPVNGISSDAHISRIFEDQRGFFWLGTSNGLYRFDGHTFHRCTSADSTENSAITAIFEDQAGQLWVGFNSGMIKYYQQENLHRWDIEEGLPKVPITGFQQDPSGHFWISTYGEGLYCFREGHLFNFDEDDGLASNEIYSMTICANGKIWIGTDRGLNICSWSGDQKIIEHHGLEDGIPDEIILTLARGEGEEVWLGTHDKGFGSFHPKTLKFSSPVSNWMYGPVTNLSLGLHDQLYISTENGNLFSYEPGNSKVTNLANQLQEKPKSIEDHTIDRLGNLWLLKNQGGLCLVNDRFQYYDLTIGSVQAICHDHQNAIWIGTQKGLFRIRLDSEPYEPETHLSDRNLNIISLDLDKSGNLWIGTFGQGLFAYDSRNQRIKSFTEKNGLPNNSILSVRCTNSEIWLASLGGAATMNGHENVFRNKPGPIVPLKGLGSNYIYFLFEDSKNRIWIGTDGKGLSRIESDGIRNYQTDNLGESIKTIYSITEDKHQTIWAISSDGKIYYNKNDIFTRFENIPDGLSLAGITCNNFGEIVITHHHGIIVIDPLQKKASFLEKAYNFELLEPNLNTFTHDREKNLWLGSAQGIIKISAKGSISHLAPRTFITRTALFENSLFQEPPFTLKPSENFLSFEFVGLSYLQPQKVHYRYQLEGFELNWNITRDQRVSYARLPAGHYKFKVQASDTDQFEENHIEEISFEIKKALFDRAVFWIIVVIIGYTLIYLLAKYREKKLQNDARRKREQIEFQYHQLQSQLNPHFLFNSYNTLINIIEEKPEIATEYVEKLSDFYRQILTLKEKEIVSLAEEIQLVEDYFYLIKKRYGENIQLTIRVKSLNQKLAPLSLQMLVENAIKHNIISRKRPLKIEIYEANGRIHVENNLQPKLSPEKSTGFGLKNILDRYAILSESPVEIHKTNTTFSVSIPLIPVKQNV